MFKVLLSMGTRPEIIKMAPVHRALADAGAEVAVLHTGQHEEMAWPLYAFFGIPLPHVVQLKRSAPSLAHLSSRLLEEVGVLLERERPDALLVHGDTSSALMGALAAFYLQIPIGHVEAGLRTGARYDPFPEEKNRELIGRLAEWHFAPTAQATSNLRREGVAAESIHEVGNTVVDAANWGLSRLDAQSFDAAYVLPESLHRLPSRLDGSRLVLVTAHRRENWGGGIGRIATALGTWLELNDDGVAVWPVHGNPLVQREVAGALRDLPAGCRERLFLCEPLGYPALLWVMRRAWLIMTDSGGIQEEAISVQTPVLVLRETTERPEVIAVGAGVLVGTAPEAILGALRRLGADRRAYLAMRGASNPFGDGRAAHRIAAILQRQLVGRRPAPAPGPSAPAVEHRIAVPQ